MHAMGLWSGPTKTRSKAKECPRPSGPSTWMLQVSRAVQAWPVSAGPHGRIRIVILPVDHAWVLIDVHAGEVHYHAYRYDHSSTPRLVLTACFCHAGCRLTALSA